MYKNVAIKGEIEMPESKKTVGEIFNDYQTKSLIKDASIGSLNVVKKTNTLGILLISNNYIEIANLYKRNGEILFAIWRISIH